MVINGERCGRKNQEFAINIHTAIYKIVNNDLLYTIGNSTQYSIISYMGKEFEKEGYMDMNN